MDKTFILDFISKNVEFVEKFKNKKIFVVNHTSFYGRLFEFFFTQIGAELICGSRENGFDILNRKDVDHFSYREADIIIYPGIDFSDYKDIDNQVVTSVNLVVGLGNLLEKKKENCIFYSFNSDVTDLLYCPAIYSAINLMQSFIKVTKNCFEPYIPIYRQNPEYCFIEMIKDIAKKL